MISPARPSSLNTSSLNTSARQRLADQQADLLRALLTGAEVPAGFDADRIDVQAAALRGKRGRITATLRPDLVDTLGKRFGVLFDAYAREHPRTENIRATQEATGFASWLADHGELAQARRRWWQRG